MDQSSPVVTLALVISGGQVSGMDIAPDEVVTKLEDHGKLSFDGKRDLWAGYREDEFARVVER